MKELAGRFARLDETTTASIRIISEFDSLLAAGAGIGKILETAARIANTVIGYSDHKKTIRYSPSGLVTSVHDARSVSTVLEFKAGRLWLERQGSKQDIDELLLERVSITISVRQNQNDDSPRAVDVALDTSADLGTRRKALIQMRIEPESAARVFVQSPDFALKGPRVTEQDTVFGLLALGILQSGDASPQGPHALGPMQRAIDIADTVPLALSAWALLRGNNAVLDSADLGIILPALNEISYQLQNHEDVAVLRTLDARTIKMLEALMETGSVRAVARQLGLHHSTVISRLDSLMETLGYDPRLGIGRTRLSVSLLTLAVTPKIPPFVGK